MRSRPVNQLDHQPIRAGFREESILPIRIDKGSIITRISVDRCSSSWMKGSGRWTLRTLAARPPTAIATRGRSIRSGGEIGNSGLDPRSDRSYRRLPDQRDG
jgi:hypothetical protein